jgi:hypothetical protein
MVVTKGWRVLPIKAALPGCYGSGDLVFLPVESGDRNDVVCKIAAFPMNYLLLKRKSLVTMKLN